MRGGVAPMTTKMYHQGCDTIFPSYNTILLHLQKQEHHSFPINHDFLVLLN